MKTEEVTKYWQELADGAGLSAEQMKAVSEVLGEEKVSKAFVEKFMPVADHHRTVDKVKGDSTKQLEEAQGKLTQYQEWYEKQAKPAYDQVLTNMQEYNRYKETYGPLENGDKGGDKGGNNNDNVLTRDDLEKTVSERTAALNSQWSDMWTFGIDAADDFRDKYGKRFPVKEFRKFAEEKQLPLEVAYKEFEAPFLAEKEKADRENWEKKKAEEIERDLRSKLNAPSEDIPSEPHTFFDRKAPEKDADPVQEKVNSKSGFLAGWGGQAG
jgi:hypothetical protein